MKKIAFMLATIFSLNTIAMAGFTDMENHWAKRFVELLEADGIVSGVGNGLYNPDANIQADEFLKLTSSALGFKSEGGGSYWATPYIEYILDKEILWDGEITNYSAPITRGDSAKVLVRAVGLENSTVPNEDSYKREISDFFETTNEYKPYILKAYANGLIKGFEDHSFRYKSFLTRAEATVLITRLLKLKPLEGHDSPTIDTDNFYYVSPTGNDANDGSEGAPFKTIARARDKVREIIAAGVYPENGITVYLRGGDYELNETLTFDASDSGTKEAPVKYTSYKGEVANITGSVKLDYSDFKPVSADISAKLLSKQARSNVLQLDLKAKGITDLGELSRRGFLINAGVSPQAELYINDSRMQLSRWPNTDWVGTTEIVSSGARSKSGVLQGAVYKIDYNEPTKWKTNITDIYTSGVLGPNYFYGYFPIGKIENGQITLREGSVTSYYSKHFIRYENILEETDMPGEYYIDRATGMLYLYPPEGFGKDSDIRISQLDAHLIKMDGAKYITFENLKLNDTRQNAIRATGAEGLTFKNLEVSGIGVDGIYINGTNNTVANCHIHDIGSNGVSMSGGDYDKLIANGNVIENNHIEKVAQIERSYLAGIMLGYKSVGTVVRNNKIHNTPHAAIIIYGPEHLVENNEIYDAVLEFHDMDAIYLNVYQYPWERGVMIKNNYFHDLGHQTFTEKQMNVAGIRTDNQGNGLNVIGNIFYNIGTASSNQVRAVCAEGTENVIDNNIFVDVADIYDSADTYKADAKWDITSDTVKPVYEQWQKYCGVYGAKYPEVLDFYNHHHASNVGGNKFRNNIIVNISVPISTANGGINAYGFRGSEQLVEATGNYITKTDPGFVDYANKNFNLKPDSVVYTQNPSFEKIDFSKIGIISGTTIGIER